MYLNQLCTSLSGVHDPLEVKQLEKEKVKFISCGEEHTAVLTEVYVFVCILHHLPDNNLVPYLYTCTGIYTHVHVHIDESGINFRLYVYQ